MAIVVCNSCRRSYQKIRASDKCPNCDSGSRRRGSFDDDDDGDSGSIFAGTIGFGGRDDDSGGYSGDD